MNMAPPSLHWRGSRVKSLAAAVLLVLAAAASHPALMAQTPAPVIEKLKPASGPVGTKVKIKGSNFGTSPGTVTFNGTNAPVNPNSNWDSAKIQVKVPEGATTGPVVVTVGTQSSAGVTFTVTSAPSGPIISKLKPDSAPVGTEIKIKGPISTVTFNSIGTTRQSCRRERWAGGGDDGVDSSNGVAFDVTDGVPIISKLKPDSGPSRSRGPISATRARSPSMA